MEPDSDYNTSVIRMIGVYALIGGATLLSLRLRRQILWLI